MAKYQKGQSGNPAGRPVGAKDKVPRGFRALAQEVVAEHSDDVQRALLNGINSRHSFRYLMILAHLEKQQHEHDVLGVSEFASALSRKVIHELHPGPSKAA